jgi:hypothetical protein
MVQRALSVVQGMLESLQRGEGVPQVDAILDKRRAKIAEAVINDDNDDDYNNYVADDGDAAGAPPSRSDVGYRPHRAADSDPLLPDDDDYDVGSRSQFAKAATSVASRPVAAELDVRTHSLRMHDDLQVGA